MTDLHRTNNKRKSLVVKFATLEKKREVIKKLRERGGAEKRGSDNSQNASDVYMVDQLTPTYRKLLWMAKTNAKSNSWNFFWVRDGNKLAKKNETTKVVNIESDEDLFYIK